MAYQTRGVPRQMAVMSLVAGILGGLSLIYEILMGAIGIGGSRHLPTILALPLLLGPVAAIVAIVTGHLARRLSKRDGIMRPDIAIAGLILGYGYLLLLVLQVLALALILQSGGTSPLR